MDQTKDDTYAIKYEHKCDLFVCMKWETWAFLILAAGAERFTLNFDCYSVLLLHFSFLESEIIM